MSCLEQNRQPDPDGFNLDEVADKDQKEKGSENDEPETEAQGDSVTDESPS